MPLREDMGFGMAGGREGRPIITRSFIVWAVVALAGSIVIFVVGSDLYARLVAFLIFLSLWTIVWRIAVGIRESEGELRAKR